MPPSEPPANEAFDCLVLRHLDGCCGEQERQELAEALRHDARKREQFTRLACQHGQLRELLISDHLLAMQPPVPRRRPPPKRTSTTWGKRHLVAAAALVAVAVTVVAVLHTASPPHATMIAGQLAVIRAGHSTPLPVGARVVAGDRLMMSGEGRAQLQLADGSALILSSAAILAVTSLDAATSGIALRLEQGSIEAEVAPQPIDHPLVIATVQSQATVVGTHFTLSCDSRASHLEVVKGIVRFRDPYSDPVLVNAGYIAESHEGRAISLHRIGEPEPPDLSVAGTGLKGDYYDSMEFQDYRFSRLDSEIDFNWGPNAPDPRIEPETFSIRWTGQLVARSQRGIHLLGHRRRWRAPMDRRHPADRRMAPQ
jgi:ferric-dicitrate binding protein FerR (iron transport regulator)